jgi:hypothetical protein
VKGHIAAAAQLLWLAPSGEQRALACPSGQVCVRNALSQKVGTTSHHRECHLEPNKKTAESQRVEPYDLWINIDVAPS